MRGALVMLVSASAGCDQLFKLDHLPDAAIDAPITAIDAALDCTGIPFVGTGDVIPEFNGRVVGDPTASASMNDVVFVGAGDTSLPYTLYWAHRASTSDPYTFDLAPFDDPAFDDIDPSISPDGTRVVFLSSRKTSDPKGTRYPYEVVKTSQGTWAPEQELAGVSTDLMYSIDFAPGGLTIFFNNPSGLNRARRQALGAPFTIDTIPASSIVLDFPTVSTDELEVFYSVAGSVYSLSRASIADDWAMSIPSPVVAGSDPALSADGQRLLYTGDKDLHALYRNCARN